jgi:transcriptional regulator
MMLYAPAHFAVERRDIAAALIRAHPLATLITQDADGPAVSHVPLLLDDRDGHWFLLGHVARANPHWETWRNGGHGLAIFHGPDAYISPSLYAARKAVPTWNYAVVHVHGSIDVMHESEPKERVLKALIDAHDPAYHAQWNELEVSYREGMKQGIVAFAIDVERIDAKFKLSQNRPQVDRERVLGAMQSGTMRDRELADWMQRLVPGDAR